MILIVCVDDDYGMAFNHRRQSSDRVVTSEILRISAGKILWVAPYTASLFPEAENISVDDSFMDKAQRGDVCFVERIPVEPWLNKAEQIIIFRWNRKYPFDVKFPYDLLKNQWVREETKEFTGSSHDKITMEVYHL